jgi:hypothetical protein
MFELPIVVFSLWLSTFAVSTAAAQQQDCRSIQDPKGRLECYDALPQAPVAPKKPAQAAPGQKAPNASAESGCLLKRSKDAMTDKVSCYLTPAGNPHVQITPKELYISFRGRGGVWHACT